MLNGSTPIFAGLTATILLRRLPGKRQRIGLGLGFVGMILIGLPSVGQGPSSTLGALMVLSAVACYGIAFNVAVPL
ncbi:MAG: drug/metabolite transporter (DMT)-like permease [Candidatus Poriferisodalaceae bacterium]|jgi:drug/metabolite transporter (DMT)-like permease